MCTHVHSELRVRPPPWPSSLPRGGDGALNVDSIGRSAVLAQRSATGRKGGWGAPLSVGARRPGHSAVARWRPLRPPTLGRHDAASRDTAGRASGRRPSGRAGAGSHPVKSSAETRVSRVGGHASTAPPRAPRGSARLLSTPPWWRACRHSLSDPPLSWDMRLSSRWRPRGRCAQAFG